jgi:hypothetical protein
MMEDKVGLQLSQSAPDGAFIGGQPSMAEFLTSLPILDDVGVHVDVLANSSASAMDDLNHSSNFYDHHAADLNALGLHDATSGAAAGKNSAEYPWMKEKKAARKNNAHCKLHFNFNLT